MPRGKKTASSEEAQVVRRQRTKKAVLPKKKTMEASDDRVTVGRKRKQEAANDGGDYKCLTTVADSGAGWLAGCECVTAANVRATCSSL